MKIREWFQYLDSKQQFTILVSYLKRYLSNPISAIQAIPHLEKSFVVFLIGLFYAISGGLRGVLSGSFGSLLAGLIFFPIGGIISATIISGFFYYTFLYFYKVKVSPWKILEIFLFAGIPFLALHILSLYVSVIDVIGAAVTALLLIVGFSENLNLDRKKITKLILGVFCIYFLFWTINRIQFSSKHKIYNKNITPESLDILEKELK